MKRNHTVILAIAWIASLIWIHVVDSRIYYEDVGKFLRITLDFVDGGVFPAHGASIINAIHLGPFANLLAAIPLLATRSIYGQYYFLSFLLVLSIPVFYWGCREMEERGPFKVVATAQFALSSMLWFPPRIVEHTFYLPLFFALYFWLLVRFVRRSRLYALPLWFLTGLCMHLHFTCAWLIAATAIATWFVRTETGKRALIILSMLGLAIMALTQFHLISDIRDSWLMDVPTEPHAVSGEYGFWDIFKRTGANYVQWIAAFPFVFGFTTFFYGVAALLRRRKILALGRKNSPILSTALFYTISGIVIFPLLSALRYRQVRFTPHYFFSTSVFIAILVGMYFQWKWRSLNQKSDQKKLLFHSRVFVVLSIMSICVCFLPYQAPQRLRTYYEMNRLDDMVEISRNLAGIIRSGEYKDVNVAEYIYEGDGKSIIPRSVTHQGIKVLMLYEQPDLDAMIEDYSENAVLVIMANHEADLPESQIPTLSTCTLLDRFKTQHLTASVYLGSHTAFHGLAVD